MENQKLTEFFSHYRDIYKRFLWHIDLTFYDKFSDLFNATRGEYHEYRQSIIRLGLESQWIVGEIDGRFWVVAPPPEVGDAEWPEYIKAINFQSQIAYVLSHPTRRSLKSSDIVKLIQLRVLDINRRRSGSDMHYVKTKVVKTFWKMMEDGTLKRAADGGVELADK